MKDSYSTYLPPVLHFGRGTRSLAADEADRLAPEGARIFLVTSQSVRKQELGEDFVKSLGKRVVGELIGIPHDPPLECVDDIRKKARQAKANLLLAIGGGSVMDATKTAAFLAQQDEPTAAFFRGELPLPAHGLPFLALPTTAGTGAEITKNAVLTDQERDFKGSIRSPQMVASVAIVDPDFTLALPKRVTADSGLDALTQAIESYVSSGASALSKTLALEATFLLLRWLPLAWEDGGNAEARTKTAEGSMLSAMAFSQSGLGAVHGLAHPIGHRLNLAHGFTCAVLLPHIIRYNLPVCREAFDHLGAAAGCSDSRGLCERVEWLCKHLQVPQNFPTLQPADIPYIVKNCRSGSMKANPRFMSDEDVTVLLQRLTNNPQ
ncbi:MAG: iron-containing alcohol dehydrogenase [Victivallales bacterium]|nr:iron-containing alcohol dehydrogenase [Victivallales bacterium]